MGDRPPLAELEQRVDHALTTGDESNQEKRTHGVDGEFVDEVHSPGLLRRP